MNYGDEVVAIGEGAVAGAMGRVLRQNVFGSYRGVFELQLMHDINWASSLTMSICEDLNALGSKLLHSCFHFVFLRAICFNVLGFFVVALLIDRSALI